MSAPDNESFCSAPLHVIFNNTKTTLVYTVERLKVFSLFLYLDIGLLNSIFYVIIGTLEFLAHPYSYNAIV